MFSKLVSKLVLAHSNNYQKGRAGKKICKITPHHAVCVCSAERIAQEFQKPTRYASANYCIGNNGGIVCSVYEEDRAYTSCSDSNDNQAITIEIANSSLGGDYPISDKAWKSLVALCVDICTRYGFILNYDGTKNGSLTEHRMFAQTACPGQYLHSRMNKLADEVNAQLKPKLVIESITNKKVKIIRETNLWNLDFTDIAEAKAVKTVEEGMIIEDVSAIVTHPCGSRYYMTHYSYSHGIHNGFNMLDCVDYVEEPKPTQEEPKQENTVEQPTDDAKIGNLFKNIIDMIIKLLKLIFKG